MKETLLLLCLIVTVFCQLANNANQVQRRPGVFPSYPKLSNQGSARRDIHVFTKLDDRTADPCNEFVDTTKGFRDCQTVPDPQVTVLLPSENSDHPWVPRILQQQDNAALTLTGRGFSKYKVDDLKLTLVNPVLGCGSLSQTNVKPTNVVNVKRGDGLDTALTFIPPASWIAKDFELIHRPYSLCFSTDNGNTYTYTGFKIQTTWHCSDTTPCSTKQPTNPPKAGGAGYDQLTSEELKIRNARLTCCKAGSSSTIGVGQCIFTSTDGSGAPTSCCGNARVEVATERCCNAANAWVTWLDTPCPCRQVDELGNSPRCPGSELCCFNSKYPEFDAGVGAIGECYNPTTHRCCRSGMRYDPGAQQCCAITGVQSLNVPCPCSTDEHCRGNSIDVTARESTLRCCAQTEPAPFEIQECSIYSNYPEGTGPYQSARCNGKCMDPQYQICCNGVLCAKEYEKCCNSTCCNRFTQTCEPSFRRPAPGNPANPIDFFVRYEVCSTIEQMTPHKALWLFVYPTIWLLTTFLSTGIVLVFANKASSRSYAAIEQAIISVALLLILFSLVLFFSPAFKYTFVILFIELIAILTAASRVLKLNVVCLALHFVLLLYLLDPFHGNQWFTLSYHRMTNGRPDRETAGIMHTIFKMWRNLKSVEEEHWCPDWYLGYGRHDPLLRDTDRFDNPDMFNFAYCNRSYIALLLIFSAIILLLGLVQLMLVLLALLLRFTKPSVKLIVREEYDSGEEVPLY